MTLHLLARVAPPLRVNRRDDLIADARGPLLDGADDAAHHAAGDTAPGALASPRWAFAALVTCALTLAQRPCGEARALRWAPPARAGQGKAPQEGCSFLAPKALAP